uniref:Uncharacterized protein n=1 Tax=Solanum tuberosum TaxID=4113 RepID=M1DSR4_SOLTU
MDYGLRSKARTLSCKKEQSELKEGRKENLVIAKSIWRVAEWPFDRLKFQCAKPRRKEPSWREKGAVGGSLSGSAMQYWITQSYRP